MLDPEAWILFHIKNVNPFDSNDNLRYGGFIEGGSPQDNIGDNIDLWELRKSYGNKNIPLSWWVTKNNITNQYRDTIYSPARDTMVYEIFY